MMKLTARLLVGSGLLLANIYASALTLDFIDNSNVLIGSIRFSNTELDTGNQWSITPGSLTGGANVYSEPGVVDIYVTLYDTDGNPTYTGSSWSDATASGTILGLLNSGIGNHAKGGTITVSDSYFMYPYDINGNPIFDNGQATVTPLEFIYSDVTGADQLVILDLGIDSLGNFVVHGAPPPASLLLDYGLISVIATIAKRRNK